MFKPIQARGGLAFEPVCTFLSVPSECSVLPSFYLHGDSSRTKQIECVHMQDCLMGGSPLSV